MKLSIVVPCYNEAKNIPLVLERFDRAFKKTKMQDAELILVDNNSKDDSAKVLKKELKKYKFARTVFQEKPGYGNAVQLGLSKAKGEFLCWTHADLQTDPADTVKVYRLLLKQKDPKKVFIKGDRKGRSIFDNFFTRGMTFFEFLLLGKWLWDINAQPNCFHKSFLKLIPNPPGDFSWDLYLFYTAKTQGYEVVRFPVLFPERIHGTSSWNTSFGEKYKFIKRTMKFSREMKAGLKE